MRHRNNRLTTAVAIAIVSATAGVARAGDACTYDTTVPIIRVTEAFTLLLAHGCWPWQDHGGVTLQPAVLVVKATSIGSPVRPVLPSLPSPAVAPAVVVAPLMRAPLSPPPMSPPPPAP